MKVLMFLRTMSLIGMGVLIGNFGSLAITPSIPEIGFEPSSLIPISRKTGLILFLVMASIFAIAVYISTKNKKEG